MTLVLRLTYGLKFTGPQYQLRVTLWRYVLRRGPFTHEMRSWRRGGDFRGNSGVPDSWLRQEYALLFLLLWGHKHQADQGEPSLTLRTRQQALRSLMTHTQVGGDTDFILMYTTGANNYFLKRCILEENFNFKKIKRKTEQCLNLYFS